MNAKNLIVTQVKSSIGRLKSHQACLKGLGIRCMHQPVQVVRTPENLGMVSKINYMLRVEDA